MIAVIIGRSLSIHFFRSHVGIESRSLVLLGEQCITSRTLLVLRAVFNMLLRNASPRGPMCFRCLMFNLSGPCKLLFLLCFIASWT